jgi:putative ABC transport system substrate-binding protein
MQRRSFVILLGAALAVPFCSARRSLCRSARAQGAPRVIGFLHQGPQAPSALMTAFSHGLSETGVVEGRDVRIEHRAADGHYDRLPALAKELVNTRPAVMTADFLPASLALKAATQTIPIVFLTGSDPIASGLVSSFNRPMGNVTGIAFMFTRLGPKNLEFLHELLPNTAAVSVGEPDKPQRAAPGRGFASGGSLAWLAA